MKYFYLYDVKILIAFLIFILTGSTGFAQNFVLLDPGHGGSDDGAPGVCGISEKFLNLDYALDAYDKIDDDEFYYWVSYSTRDDDDDYLTPTARYQMANNLNNDQVDAFGYLIPNGGVNLFLSVHCNSSTNNTVGGTEVLYKEGSETDLRIKRSKICATILLQAHLNETKEALYSAQSRWIKPRSDLGVLNGTTMPAILLETEFISNPNICSWMSTFSYIDAVGTGINFLMKCISPSNNLWIERDITSDITSYEGWGGGCLLFRNTNNGATQYRYVNNTTLDIQSWSPFRPTKVIIDDNVHVATSNGGIINASPAAIYIVGQGGSFPVPPTGIEDAIYVYTDHEVYDVNTTHYGCQHSEFIDNGPPPEDYITEWYPFNVWASSSCGDILVSSDGIIIPTLPTGYNWNRDANGNVIANMTRSGIDNDGILHTGSAPIKIGNVPNTFITSGTLTSDTYWCGVINITGNIIIPVNVTLNVYYGSLANFNSSSSLIVNGSLIINGATFDFISPNSTYQNGIKVNPGGSLNISNSIVKNAYRGVYINEAEASIDASEFFNCQTGIYLYRTNYTFDDPYITNNYTHNNSSGSGIANYYSSPYLTGNEVSYNYTGVGASSYSSPYLGYAGAYGNNNIHDNYRGVYAISYSNPFLGRATCTLQGGNNIIENNTFKNIQAQTYCTIIAENNWWGSDPPDANKIYALSGSTIDYNPWLQSPPNQQSANRSDSPEEQLYNQNFSILKGDEGSSSTEGSTTYNFDPAWPIFWKLLYARNLIDVRDFKFAQQILKEVINSNPDSSLSSYALDLLWRASRKSDVDSFKLFLNDLSVLKGKKDVYAQAQLILAGYDKEKGVNKLDAVMKSYSNTPFAEMAIFQKFLYYFNDLNDLINAKEIVNQMDVMFPKSELTADAHRHLGESGFFPKMIGDPNDNGNSKILASNQNIPTEYQLLGNYPNPFNPSTTINYALPFESEVAVKIFDLTGSTVKTFTLDNVSPGYKDLLWDGRNNYGVEVSSGVYIYMLNAISLEGNGKSFTKSSKLLLLK